MKLNKVNIKSLIKEVLQEDDPINDIINNIIFEEIVGKNPFKVGDLVKLRPDVLERYSRRMSSKSEPVSSRYDWKEVIKNLQDQIGKVIKASTDTKTINVKYPQISIANYTELIPTNEKSQSIKLEFEEGFGYVHDKDMAKDPKHIKGERWRIKFQSASDIKKHGNTEKSDVNEEEKISISEIRNIIKKLINEMWIGWEEQEESANFYHPSDQSSVVPQIPGAQKLSMMRSRKPTPKIQLPTVPKSSETPEQLRARLLAKLHGKKDNVSEVNHDKADNGQLVIAQGAPGSIIRFTTTHPVLMKHMRDWVKDVKWREVSDEADIDDMTDEEILRGVEKHYQGGIKQFMIDARFQNDPDVSSDIPRLKQEGEKNQDITINIVDKIKKK